MFLLLPTLLISALLIVSPLGSGLSGDLRELGALSNLESLRLGGTCTDNKCGGIQGTLESLTLTLEGMGSLASLVDLRVRLCPNITGTIVCTHFCLFFVRHCHHLEVMAEESATSSK